MKTYIPYSLLAAIAATGMAVGAETAYTTPVGYASQSIAQGFNLVGLTLQTPTLAAGNLDTVSAGNVTDAALTLTPTAGKTYVLEITSGTATGVIVEVPAASITGTTISTGTTNLVTAGVVIGDTYKIRVAPTIEEIFKTDGTIVSRGANSGVADVIWVPNGSSYDQYFIHPAGVGTVRIAGGQVLAPNVPLIYADGVLVQKKSATTTTSVVSGEVKKVGTNSVAIQGFNLVSIVAPVGLNLFNSGLATDIAAGANPGVADLLWVPTGAGVYTKYFRHPASGGSWRTEAAPLVALTQPQAEAVILPPAILIQRKSATPAAISIAVPTSYATL